MHACHIERGLPKDIPDIYEMVRVFSFKHMLLRVLCQYSQDRSFILNCPPFNSQVEFFNSPEIIDFLHFRGLRIRLMLMILVLRWASCCSLSDNIRALSALVLLLRFRIDHMIDAFVNVTYFIAISAFLISLIFVSPLLVRLSLPFRGASGRYFLKFLIISAAYLINNIVWVINFHSVMPLEPYQAIE